MKAVLAILFGVTAALTAGTAHADTVVRVLYPAEGHTLTLRGEAPLRWDQDLQMTRVEDGVYEATFIVAPAEVKPLLDGQWSLGANFKVRPGSENNFAPRFFHATGRVEQLTLDARVAGGRRVWAYLPPSYDETPARRFPVIYAQDGQNVFESTRGTGSPVTWSVDRALDGDFADDPRLPETIVVGIESVASRIYDYTPTPDASQGGQGGGADQYLDWMLGDLKAAIDGQLRTRVGGADVAIMGSSLGGLLAAYAAATRSDKIAAAAIFSPSTWWSDRVVVGDVAALRGASVRPARIYVDYGAERDGGEDTALLVQALVGVAYTPDQDLLTVVDPLGEHDETSWARRFPAAARFLLVAF